MKLLERYIFKKALVAALAVTASLAGVIWIVQAMGNIDVISSKGQTIFTYFAITTLVVPMLVVAVIPIALLLATVHVVNTLNTNTELVVINASGASNGLIVKPFFLVALLCSLLTGLVGHFVMAKSLVTLNSYKSAMNADLVSALIREGAFTKLEKGFTFHVGRRLEGGRLGDILISDERSQTESLLYSAREGIIEKKDGQALLLLFGGEVHQTTRKDRLTSVIKYDSYAFNLSNLMPQRTKAPKSLRPKERTTPELFGPDPDDKYLKEQPHLFAFEIHTRFAEMIWPFTYVLVMLAFCGQARSSRQGYGTAIATGLAFVAALRGLGFSAQNGIAADERMVFAVYALPLIGIGFAAFYLYRNQPVTLPRALQPIVGRFNAQIELWQQKLEQRRQTRTHNMGGAVS